MWQSLAQWAAGGGVAGIVVAALYFARLMYRDTLQAYKDQAAAWERIAIMHERRADLREAQLGQVLGRASESV